MVYRINGTIIGFQGGEFEFLWNLASLNVLSERRFWVSQQSCSWAPIPLEFPTYFMNSAIWSFMSDLRLLLTSSTEFMLVILSKTDGRGSSSPPRRGRGGQPPPALSLFWTVALEHATRATWICGTLRMGRGMVFWDSPTSRSSLSLSVSLSDAFLLERLWLISFFPYLLPSLSIT